MKRETKFKKLLVGKTIKSVDATCINYVKITFDDGTEVSFDVVYGGVPNLYAIEVEKCRPKRRSS